MSDGNHTAIVTAERGSVQRMHPLVEAAIATNPDPATLREFLALQRDWEAGEARKAYTAALIALKRDMPTVVAKDKNVEFQGSRGPVRYSHTTLAALIDAVTPHLTAHGFSLGWTPRTHAGGLVEVTCRLTHAGGHSEETTIAAPIDTSGSKSPAQGVASTITLLERYTAAALLGIVSRDMSEPTPPAADPKRVDAARTLKAVGELAKRGIATQAAEDYLGRPVSEWTSDDLDKLKAWLKQGSAAHGRFDETRETKPDA